MRKMMKQGFPFGFNPAVQNAQMVSLPFTSNLSGKGSVTFSRASSQWGTNDSGALTQVATNTSFFSTKGVLLEPAITNKVTCYGAIPADSYGSTRTSGYALVNGVKYEIISRSTLDFTTVGAANNTVGTQFVATGGTLGSGDSVKDVLFGVGTKTYYFSGWIQNFPNLTVSGDTTASLSIVDDSATLTTAGLINLFPSGKVYKFDNSGGAGAATIDITGSSGNTNTHTLSIFHRGTGASYFDMRTGYVDGDYTPPTASYTRRTKTLVAGNAADNMRLNINAGVVLYFVLPQMEELSFASSPVVTTGATAARAATSLSVATQGTPRSGYFDWTPTATYTTARYLMGSYTDANNSMGIIYDGTTLMLRKRVGGANYDATKALAATVGTTYRIGWRVNGDTTTDILVNEVKGTTQANTVAPVWAATIKLGEDGNNANQQAGQVKNFTVYRKSQPDSKL